jgi:hypothetical protein
MVYKVFFFIFCFSLLSFSSMAQNSMPQRFLEFGFNTNSYKGDLSHSYSQWANGINIGILNNKKKRFNGHFGLFIGKAVAQNPNYFYDDGSNPQPTPNNFASIFMIALDYDLHLNLYKKKNLIVYIYQGIGALRFASYDADHQLLSNQLNTRAQNESYTNTTFVLPNGIGVLYVTKPGFGFGFQAGWLNSTTHYLDNISQWGDRKKNDNVLTYRLNFYIPLTKARTDY